MIRVFLVSLVAFIAIPLCAQESVSRVFQGDSTEIWAGVAGVSDSISGSVGTSAVQPELYLPRINPYGRVLSSVMWDMSYPGWGSWNLHPGLNVSLGAAVTVAFGKHSYSGTGFSQNISAMYAVPLNPRLSLAVGGSFDNISWAGNSHRSVGLTAVLGYKFDEHWEGYLYAQKSIYGKRHMPYNIYYMSDISDRIGASVKYNFNPTLSIQVSVESRTVPAACPVWHAGFPDSGFME